MNAPDLLSTQAKVDPVESGRIEALNRFEIQQFQSLSKDDLLMAQQLAGHGSTLGLWQTGTDICPSPMIDSKRHIAIAKRIRHFLNQRESLTPGTTAKVNELIDEGVLTLTRLALLMRLAPISVRSKSQHNRLKPSSLAHNLYNYWPKIMAVGIQRKLANPDATGLLSCLTLEDATSLNHFTEINQEFKRLDRLHEIGCWSDLPPHPNITHQTDPSGPASVTPPQEDAGEWQPLSESYLQAFGPRNLWLIQELGPCLLPLLDDLDSHFNGLDWERLNEYDLTKVIIPRFIKSHIAEHPWNDRQGRPLQPPFPLITGARGKSNFAFPPVNWANLKVLSATLQSAHLFMTLLMCAGRIGEVMTLQRSCIGIQRDGKDYVRGYTYKLSGNLFGDERTWPAPAVLLQTLGQQARLANVWGHLPPGNVADGPPQLLPDTTFLWLSLGASGTANAAAPLKKPVGALTTLATRLGMDPKPDGINLHPHRLRKTIGRLAGIALFNSPLTLKRLFGHKSIEMTLRYILTDKNIRSESEAVLRELRILNCAEMLQEVRDAIAAGTPLPAHGGAAAQRMAEAVKEHESRLQSSGKIWTEGTASDLAYLLTASGQGWRYIRKNIICTKIPGEAGLCRKNRGEPNTGNCKPGCDNRIVLAMERRDVAEVAQAYIDTAYAARESEDYSVFDYSMQRLQGELDAFPDLAAQFANDTRLQSLWETLNEIHAETAR